MLSGEARMQRNVLEGLRQIKERNKMSFFSPEVKKLLQIHQCYKIGA